MKKMNNKGFSLVELIIVIAIMAILIAVLAPQYLRYVEKSRLQADNSAIGEVANAVKIAAADDTINNLLASGDTVTLPTTAGNVTCTVSALQTELNNVVGDNVQLKSNTYTKGGATLPTVAVSIDSNGVAVVTGNNYISEVGGSAFTISF